MNYKDYIDNVRSIIKGNLNDYLEKKGLTPISAFVDNFLTVDHQERSIAIYPDSPSGSTYRDGAGYATAGFTVCFYLNEDMSAESEAEALTYYSYILQFLRMQSFSESDTVAESLLTLMDLGEPKNGAFFSIESRLATHTDSDILKELLNG